jgi:hypothetical protein
MNELLFEDAVEDYPGRVRIVVDEDDGDAQLGLIWSIRNRHYSSAATAATRFEAEALNPLDTATKVALTGASGGTVVTHGTLSTNWTPVLDMRAGGTAYPTHTGTNRLWVRYRTTSGTAVQLRSVYDVGDMVFPVENTPIRSNAGTHFFWADLGELRLDPPPVGTHRWNGIIQAKGDAGTENVSIDKVYVLNADEGYGVLRASVSAEPGLVAYSARDGFDQTVSGGSDPLAGLTAPVGGVWSGAGDADDFVVEDSGHTAQRTAVSDGDNVQQGRLARLGSGTLTRVAVQVDVRHSIDHYIESGVFCRYVDISNFLYASYAYTVYSGGIAVEVQTYVLTVAKVVAGVRTVLARAPISYSPYSTKLRIRLFADTTGRWAAWAFPASGSSGAAVATDTDTALATGGALASGGYGILDHRASAIAATRNYDDFLVWSPPQDAVLNPSQSCELRWDGMVREDVGGTAWGPVSQVIGDLPRLPPTVEGRTTEIFVKASRGDLQSLPDTGIDDISARIVYKSCWLTVPGT